MTEVINDGLLVSKPSKKTDYIGETIMKDSEPIVIDLQKSKAASVPVNKLRDVAFPSIV